MSRLIILLVTIVLSGSSISDKAIGRNDLEGIPFAQEQKPNIVLVMADDQGWGQVGYNNHPVLKTPNLDAMAESGIRFNRFYAAGPVCSPTRASVLTGRTHKRTGVPGHGDNLCLQEKTLAQALKKAGYATAHFGKWHLNGVRGAGAPVLIQDPNNPGEYGFDEWLTVTNYFDMDPLMSHNGYFEEFIGDGSEVIVDEALKFIKKQKENETPFLAVIWYGSPHAPFDAFDEDKQGFGAGKAAEQLGEIVAMDRSIGTLRMALREFEIEQNTIIWYCSDNGGLMDDPNACGGLRGLKGDVFEGGIRVPGIIEWPEKIEPAITDFPTSTMDIFPTFVDLLNLPEESLLDIHDGESILPLFAGETPKRQHGIPFDFQKKFALIRDDYKLLTLNSTNGPWELYNLNSDPSETKDLSAEFPELFAEMLSEARGFIESIQTSSEGKDYPEGEVIQPARKEFWFEMEMYEPYFENFYNRSKHTNKIGEPAPPVQLNAASVSTNLVKLEWPETLDENIAGYNIYRNDSLVAQSMTNEFQDIGLLELNEYNYVIRAFDKAKTERLPTYICTATTLKNR